MSSFPAQPKFVNGCAGQLFVMDYRPASVPLGSVLFVPPFAEELNRARRMVSLQANQLCGHGYQVVVPDLYGTGDSEGNFQDASWNQWRDDLVGVLAACGVDRQLPIYVWGLRLGALLALDVVAKRKIEAATLVLWNPCLVGKDYMTQFLRMRTMAGMIANAVDQESIADLRSILATGQSLEVAGYEVTPELVAAIDDLFIESLLSQIKVPIHWFELVSDAGHDMPPGSARVATKLKEQGRKIHTYAVEGPAFWSTPEISIAPKLIGVMSDIFNKA